MPGRLGDEGDAVPVILRKAPRGVERVARAGGVLLVPVHLTDLFIERVEELAVGDGFHARRGPAIDRFVATIGNGHVPARVVVRGRAEDDALLAEAQSPGVVVARLDELQHRAVGLEAKDALSKFQPFAAHRSVKARVADRAPDPVVEAAPQVARPGVRVVHTPAGEEHLPHVRLVIAAGILEEKRVGRLRDDDAAIREDDAGGNAQLVREHGEFIRASIAVGVLANLDPVAAFAGLLQFVWIIESLRDPQATTFIPREADGLGHLRLGGEELRLEARSHHQMLRGFLRAERLLHGANGFGQRAPLRAAHVVGEAVGSLRVGKGLQPGMRFEILD